MLSKPSHNRIYDYFKHYNGLFNYFCAMEILYIPENTLYMSYLDAKNNEKNRLHSEKDLCVKVNF